MERLSKQLPNCFLARDRASSSRDKKHSADWKVFLFYWTGGGQGGWGGKRFKTSEAS
jgi:hypothetical protein